MSFIWNISQFALHIVIGVIKPQQVIVEETPYTGIIQDGDFTVICRQEEELVNTYKIKIQHLNLLICINNARFEAMDESSIGFPEFNLILKKMTRLSAELIKTQQKLDALMA
jgi:hypothetical protein